MKKYLLIVIIAIAGLTSFNHLPQKISVKNEIKAPDHVIIIVEENHGYDQIVGSKNAPYINKLMREGATFTNSFAITHPSQANYLALFSGATQGVIGDQCLEDSAPFTSPNLAAALINKGYSFKGFSETIPYPGFLKCSFKKSDITNQTLYGRKHCPWVNWLGNKQNQIPDSLSQPMSAFPKDFNQLPTVSFVIPNMDNDMHNVGGPGDAAAIARGDKWLQKNLGAYIKWAKKHNSLLILTCDEDQFTAKNQILTIFIGTNVKPGKYTEKITHYNVFKTLEAMYGLDFTKNKDAFVIKDIWKNK